MRENILITGGAGFVGSSLALFLRNDFPNSRISVLDNLKRRGSELNIPRLQSVGVSFFHGDVRKLEDFDQVGKTDLLIDCAAEPSVLNGYNMSPAYVIQTNLGGTVNSLEYTRRNKADIIFLSTSRVYPIDMLASIRTLETKTRFRIEEQQDYIGVGRLGISEDFPLSGSRSMYGATKMSSEILVTEYTSTYGIRSIINRCGVLSGPWQMGKVDQGFVALWVAKHLFGGSLSYIGYGGLGKQVRDVLHVRDLYQLLKKQYACIDAISGQVFNVGGGIDNSISLVEMTELCQSVTRNQINIDSVPNTRYADIPLYVTNYSKIEALTGWRPKITLRETVEEIADWIAHNRNSLQSILN